MSRRTCHFFTIVLQLAFIHFTSSYLTLDRQCWHEHPLSTVEYYSSPDGLRELAQLSISTRPIKHTGDTDHAPWSYPPVCTELLQSINDRLCVYTSTSFHYGRGISLFTTPALAARYASLPAFKDPSALDSQDINQHSGTWQATPIPSKGIGVLASRDLDFKDRVTAYTPAFLALRESELGTREREEWWRRAIEQLPEKLRAEFLSLTYVYGDERVRVQDIVKANTFSVEIDGANHLAVFPETSRLNHACNPNAQYVIDTELLTHFVVATRPIAAGEEITISYTSPVEPHSVRHSHLHGGFHFTCTCPRCISPSTSDAILVTITSLQNQLNDWSAESAGSPELAEQLMKLYRDEGLEGFMDVAYGFAALAYNAAGDGVNAVAFAQKAKEAILIKDGAWGPNLGLWEEMLSGPEKHWSYRRRV